MWPNNSHCIVTKKSPLDTLNIEGQMLTVRATFNNIQKTCILLVIFDRCRGRHYVPSKR